MDVRLIKAIIHDFVKLLLHFSFPHKTTDVFSQLCSYLKVKCDDIDWYGGGSCIILKSPSQKSLREEKSWYPEDLPKNPKNVSKEYITGLRGYRCFRSILCWSLYSVRLFKHKMLLSWYEEDIQQLSSGSTKNNIFWKIFAGWHFNPCPSLPSVATDDRKQFQCLNVALNNKTGLLFLEFNWCEDIFSLFKKTANSMTQPFQVLCNRLSF